MSAQAELYAMEMYTLDMIKQIKPHNGYSHILNITNMQKSNIID